MKGKKKKYVSIWFDLDKFVYYFWKVDAYE